MKIQDSARTLEAFGVMDSQKYTVKMDAHMADILSGLYSNIPWAIVREYWSNAEDGHELLVRQGGTPPKPIQIHLPTILEPWFEVKDHGVGMDHDTVFNIYTQYGNSTKTGSNDDIGGFGIGAKAAFCYEDGTDQWTVESRFDGILRTYIAAKDADGMPTLVRLSEEPTTLPTGISVKIPVARDDFNAFFRATKRFAKRRKHEFTIVGDAVGVSDGEYESIIYTEEDDNFGWRSTTSGETGVQVIMGGVPYPVDLHNEKLGLSSESIAYLQKQSSVDIFMNIGEVRVTPSRESLKYNPNTVNTLRKTLGKLFTVRIKTFLVDLKKCKTHWDALKYLQDNSNTAKIAQTSLGGHRKIKWRSTDMSSGYKHALEVSLDQVLSKHPKGITDFKVIVLRKDWQGVHREANRVPETLLPVDAQGVVQLTIDGMTIGTSVTLSKAEHESSTYTPRIVIADCSGAISLMKEYWKREGPAGSDCNKIYLFSGEGLDAKKLSKCFQGTRIGSAEQMTSSIKAKRDLKYSYAQKLPARLKVRVGNYWQETEIDLTKGGIYIGMYHAGLDCSIYEPLFHKNMSNISEVKLTKLIKALTTLGELPLGAKLVGVPKTRRKQLSKMPNWECFWTKFAPVLIKWARKPVPKYPVNIEEIKTTLNALTFQELLTTWESNILTVTSGPLVKFQKAMRKKLAQLEAVADKSERYEQIAVLREILKEDGKTLTTTQGVDTTAIIDYHTWLHTRYPLVEPVIGDWYRATNMRVNAEPLHTYVTALDKYIKTDNSPQIKG